jgi:hypothetical protein
MCCEVCLKKATHVCSGLDVPALAFCAECAQAHAEDCVDVAAGRSWISVMKEEHVPEEATA